MSEKITITIDKPKQINVPGWGNPYPFDVDFYSFHHWLLTAFK